MSVFSVCLRVCGREGVCVCVCVCVTERRKQSWRHEEKVAISIDGIKTCISGTEIRVTIRAVHRQNFVWLYSNTLYSRYYKNCWHYRSDLRWKLLAAQQENQHHPCTLALLLCFAVHNLVGRCQRKCQAFVPLGHVCRQVGSVGTAFHDRHAELAFDFLVVHQIFFDNMEAGEQPFANFALFSGLSSFKTLFNSCCWQNGGDSPVFCRDSDKTRTTTTAKIAKTFKRLLDKNLIWPIWLQGAPTRYRQYRCSKKYRDIVKNFVSRLFVDAAIYRYSPR